MPPFTGTPRWRRATEALRIGLTGLAFVAQSASANDDAVWKAVQTEPGIVVFMRHAQPRGGNPLLWDESGKCGGESMLTEEGREHAKRIGAEFAKRGIKPVVISSPMCRCRDTAVLAFGGDPTMEPELVQVANADQERIKRFDAKAQSLIAARRGAAPLAFVNHEPNIERLALELLTHGELLVTRSNEKGEIVGVVGRIRVP